MNSQRKSITQPADWWAAFQLQAQAEGMTLSEWMGECCRVYLPSGVNSALLDRPPANRPRKIDST